MAPEGNLSRVFCRTRGVVRSWCRELLLATVMTGMAAQRSLAGWKMMEREKDSRKSEKNRHSLTLIMLSAVIPRGLCV